MQKGKIFCLIMIALCNTFGYAQQQIAWEEVTSNASWAIRYGHAMLNYDGKMWFISGKDDPGDSAINFIDDVWYSTDGSNWTLATDNPGWVGRYFFGAVVYDNKMWIMGGQTASGRKNDVWYSTDGVNWTQATANANWGPRSGLGVVVYDNKMWVISGYQPWDYRNDVWYSTDGVNWTLAIENASWPDRANHGIVVYDDKMWIIGGQHSYGDYFRDVWYSSDGINWTQATNQLPWGDMPSSVVYDNKIWAFGGRDINLDLSNEVWYSTNGTNWTQLNNADWSPRGNHALVVYDNAIWVAGGSVGQLVNDVWKGTNNSHQIPFADDFSSDIGWTNDTSGDFTIGNGQLNWNADRSIVQKMYIPIEEYTGGFKLSFDFQMTSRENNIWLEVGLAESLTGAQDDPANNSTGNFVQFGWIGGGTSYSVYYVIPLARYSDHDSYYGNFDFTNSDTYIDYSEDAWFNAELEVVNNSWTLTVKNAAGQQVGQKTGTYPHAINSYNYVYIGNPDDEDWPEGNGYLDNIDISVNNFAPSITTHPLNQTLDPGQTASFSVVAEGTPPLSYQWKKNGNTVPGETADTYIIDSVTENDQGNYLCTVSNSTGSVDSNFANLSVNDPPVISSHPVSQNVDPGNSANFSVQAAGTEPLSYQWQKDGNDIPGKTADIYTIASVTENDEGNYSCTVSNSAGSVGSNTASLTVNDQPAINIHPISKNLNQGDSANFSVQATGSEPLSYQWKKDGNDIPDATSTSHTISSIEKSDEGNYYCTVTNSAGTVDSNIAILTVSDPFVTAHPVSQALDPGRKATFVVLAGGTMPLNYQWQKDGNNIPGATSPSYIIPAVQTDDEGSYHCTVTNSMGTVDSDVASLILNKPPAIIRQPVSQNARIEDTVTFSVEATGAPPLTYHWTKNQQTLSRETIGYSSKLHALSNSSSYTITSVQNGDAGIYKCTITNYLGSVESETVTLAVVKPTPLAVDLGNEGLFIYTENAETQRVYEENFTIMDIHCPQVISTLPEFISFEESWSLPTLSLLPEKTREKPEDMEKVMAQEQGFTQINTSNSSHFVWADLEGDQIPELVASFPGKGLYIHYQDGTTSQLHTTVPDYFAPVDLDGDGKQELAITFSQFGLFIYRYGEGFTLIHTEKPSYYGAVDFDGDGKEALAINFSQLGFYTYEDGDIYTKLHFVLPEQYTRADMDGDGNEELIVSFQQYGFYSYDGVAFTILHSLIPVDFCNLDIDGDGNDELAISFDDTNTYGLYIYSKNSTPTWTQIHSSRPANFAATDLNSDDKHELAITLSTLGLFIYEQDNGWRNIHAQDPEDLAGWTE